MDFLAEYDFTFMYRAGKENIPPKFLSRNDRSNSPEDDGQDEGNLGLYVGNLVKEEASGREFEDLFLEVKHYLTGFPYQEGNPKERQLVRKASNQFVVWKGKLL